MSSFEYIMVIVSIIMGLGIATLLRGSINMLRAESGWKPAHLHSIWLVNLLLSHVGLWSLRWSGEQRDVWSFAVLLAFLFMPVVYYAQAELLFPRAESKVDLSEYFMSNRRLFFTLSALNGIAAVVGPYIFYGGVSPITVAGQPELVGILAGGVFAGANVVFAFVKNLRLHLVWAWFSLLLVVGFFLQLSVG